MKQNKFIEKFKDKTDAELEEIIGNKKAYIEQARIAAIELLKSRNGNSESVAHFEKDMKADRAIAIERKIKQRAAIQSENTFKTKYLWIPFKWILIIAFFPLSLIFVAYYRQKAARKNMV